MYVIITNVLNQFLLGAKLEPTVAPMTIGFDEIARFIFQISRIDDTVAHACSRYFIFASATTIPVAPFAEHRFSFNCRFAHCHLFAGRANIECDGIGSRDCCRCRCCSARRTVCFDLGNYIAIAYACHSHVIVASISTAVIVIIIADVIIIVIVFDDCVIVVLDICVLAASFIEQDTTFVSRHRRRIVFQRFRCFSISIGRFI